MTSYTASRRGFPRALTLMVAPRTEEQRAPAHEPQHVSAFLAPAETVVPARPLFSDVPAPPGVYRSVTQLAQRWVYYALGLECELLAVRRPSGHEPDAAVVAALRELVPDEPRVPTFVLIKGGLA